MDAHQSAHIDKHEIILEANAQSLNYTPKMHLSMKSYVFSRRQDHAFGRSFENRSFSVVSDHYSNKRRSHSWFLLAFGAPP